MTGEIPDTPEIRAKAAADNAESLRRMGLKAGTVEVWEDGWRTAEEPDAFEWWYFDAQFEDGSAAVVTFNTKPHTKPDGPMRPSVLVIYRSPDGERVKVMPEFAPGEFSAATDRCDVRIGPNSVSGDLASYVLHVSVEGLTLDLTVTRESPSWRPGAAVSYFNHAKTKYLAWVVPVPYGNVTGTISRDGQTRAVAGQMYHDHNWGNAVMGSMLDHWYWGRARIGDFTLIFTQMVTVTVFGLGGIKLPVFMLAKGDRILTDDGLPLRLTTTDDTPGPGGQTYPRSITLQWQRDDEHATLRISKPELIEALDMTEDMSAWRRTVAHLFGKPMYYDFEADIDLDVDMAGVAARESGRVLYEKMMFH